MFALLILVLIILKVGDYFAVWYEKQGKPLVSQEAEQIAEQLDNTTGMHREYNASDYDVYSKSKPYLQPLDIALSLALLTALVGVFVYNKERT